MTIGRRVLTQQSSRKSTIDHVRVFFEGQYFTLTHSSGCSRSDLIGPIPTLFTLVCTVSGSTRLRTRLIHCHLLPGAKVVARSRGECIIGAEAFDDGGSFPLDHCTTCSCAVSNSFSRMSRSRPSGSKLTAATYNLIRVRTQSLLCS